MSDAYVTPRNPAIGGVADLLAALQKAMNLHTQVIRPPGAEPALPIDIPLGNMVLGKGPEFLDDLSYNGGNAFTGSGETTSLDPRALDLLQLIPGEGVAGKAGAAARDIWAGRGAATADLGAMQRAMEMLRNGKPREHVFDSTGWFQGQARPGMNEEARMRFEIPDSGAKLSHFFTDDPGMRESLRGGPLMLPNDSLKGAVVLDHPQFSAAYPELAADFGAKELVRSPRATGNGALQLGADNGDFSPHAYQITGSGKTRQELLATILHEMQHGVQEEDGFAQGGGVSAYLKDLRPADDPLMARQFGVMKDRLQRIAALRGGATKADALMLKKEHDKLLNEIMIYALTPEEAYKRLAGEAESRAIEARFMYPLGEGRKYPWESLDRPESQLYQR